MFGSLAISLLPQSMVTKNVILTKKGLAQSREQLKNEYGDDYYALLAAMPRYIETWHHNPEARCPQINSIKRYFQDHPEKEKGLSINSLNIIRGTLFKIEDWQIEEFPWTEMAVRVADIADVSTHTIELQRGSVSESPSASESTIANVTDDIPTDLPVLDVVPVGRDSV